MKKIILSCYVIALFLGGLMTYMIKSYHPQKVKEQVAPDYVLLGSKEENKDTLTFVEYDKGLFLSDSTVLKHKEGMLATPKVVSEVTMAILEDYYPHDLVQFNYPYYIYKGMFGWNVRGTCEYNKKMDYMYLHVGLMVGLQRSNGMLILRWKS